MAASVHICARVCALNAFPWGDTLKKKKKKKENTTSGSLPIRHANVWRALLERRTSRHPAETAADQSGVDAEWHRITKGRVSHERAGRRLKRADVHTTPRAALNANTGSLNATKSIRKTITRRRRRIYTLPFVEDDTNWGLLLMVLILSVGGSGFLTCPLLLRVLRASPKLNSGFHTQLEKSQANNSCAQHQSGPLANKLTPVVLKESPQQFTKHSASAKK